MTADTSQKPSVTDVPTGSGGVTRSVLSYFYAFSPAPEWDDLVCWPPDVFALANLVLDHTEAYRFVVSPPPGRRWPPLPDWDDQVRAAAGGWRAALDAESALPALVQTCWDVVTHRRETSLADVRAGEAWELTEALLTLHAIADEACAQVASTGRRAPEGSFEDRAWRMLQERGSLCRLTPTRVKIVPKTSFSSGGITIRSLSRYLALDFESVHVRWRGVEPGPPADQTDYHVLLLPWPLSVSSSAFRPVPPDLLGNMDTDVFGFFEFAPATKLDQAAVSTLLAAAVDRSGRVDAVILPEAAIRPRDVPILERLLAEHGATFLIAGAHEPPAGTPFGRNYLHFGIRTATGWDGYEQDKHHRWCLDEGQIRQYHLTHALDPKKLWWEAIDIRERTLHVIDLGGGVTAAPLVCEDLARLDEVADLVRRVGPSLVVAVLLDGPQLATRWACRYASVLTDDPGSAVLTLTAYGMAARSQPRGKPRSRVVAHWNSRATGIREIELAPGAAAVLVSAAVESRTLWTADGRRHEAPSLALTGIHQLRAR